MNASAVSDAQRNAEINGIANCKFICAKAEDVMGSLLKEYLDTPQQRDDASNSSDNDEKQNEAADNDIICVDNELDPQKCLLKGDSMETDRTHGSDKSTEDEQNNGQVDDSSTAGERFKNVVAIVDPPRSGLHPVVIKALRTHPRLRRLVYISCNPETLVANAIELCTPSAEKTEKGSNRGRGWRNMSNAGLARQRLKSMPMSEPFQPVKAMAVDLFPHTPHCELVMLLER
uniref:Uncharacterized protein n=1 Tax=Opuntia streptacantha TaxID=393608 RepID=A0A7C9E1I1_OPUST